MRKPGFEQFRKFKRIFDEVNAKKGLRQQLIPYFISSHPGCREEDMAELAAITKELDFHLEQVQDFTPTPMTVATEIYYTGYHPYTGEKVYTARTEKEKLAQRSFFFWYKPENRQQIIGELRRMNRPDLIKALYPGDAGFQHAYGRKTINSGRGNVGKGDKKKQNRTEPKSNTKKFQKIKK